MRHILSVSKVPSGSIISCESYRLPNTNRLLLCCLEAAESVRLNGVRLAEATRAHKHLLPVLRKESAQILDGKLW